MNEIFPDLSFVATMAFNGTSIRTVGPFLSNFTAPTGLYAASFIAVNNTGLSSINVPGYSSISQTDIIIKNNAFPSVTFSGITSAALDLEQVSQFTAENLQTIVIGTNPALTSVQTISGNSFETLSLPNLQSIQSNVTLVIAQNKNLAELDLLRLSSASNLEIDGNEKLRSINLPLLATVSSLGISGPVQT